MAKTSEAQLRAVAKSQEGLEQIKIWVDKGVRDEIRAYAKDHGYSGIQSYLSFLIYKDSGIVAKKITPSQPEGQEGANPKNKNG